MELIRLPANRSLALGFSMIISVILQVVGDVGGGGVKWWGGKWWWWWGGGGGQVLRARTHECKVNATLLFNFTDG